MLPIADGTDMGGSLRNPAAFCGVVGMRPSAGMIPGPASLSTSSPWESLSVDGPMARSAADVALLLGAMSSVAPPALARDFTRTRVAWLADVAGMPFERRVRSVVDGRRPLFEAIGCLVDAAQPDFSGADDVFRILRAQAFVSRHGDTVRGHRSRVKSTILDEIDRGERLTPEDIRSAEHGRAPLRHHFARFMESHEFFVLPTTQMAPFDVKEPYVRDIDGVAMSSYIDWMKSCYYISTLGCPAVSVPCGLTAEGLPVGLQIVGREGDDWGVLQLAHAFECARGPFPAP
jgi:amidase